MISRQPSAPVEALAAAGVAATFSGWGAITQAPTSSVTWDAVQYYLVSSQLAAGQVAAAEAPYVYRLGWPWLAAQFWPADPARGFFVLNLIAGVIVAVLLSLWLRHGVAHLPVRLGLVALFAGAWHGPLRYVYFNGGYVDPPFLVCVLMSLALLQSRWPRAWQVAALTALTVAGTLIRETMLLLPASALLVGNPLRANWSLSEIRGRVQWWLLVPIAAGLAVVMFTHAVVVADTTRSFFAAAVQWIQKPPTAYLLAWFTAYGPVLAILAYDWRRVLTDLGERQHLAALLLMCAGLAFLGGSDTERFVFWAMPVIYLLLGRAFERNLAAFRGVGLATGLVIAQVVSARLPWPIPDPRAETAALDGAASLADRLYAVADRVLVIEHFHWNLWSSFGSQPFRLVRLALYLAVSGLLIWGWHRGARRAVTS